MITEQTHISKCSAVNCMYNNHDTPTENLLIRITVIMLGCRHTTAYLITVMVSTTTFFALFVVIFFLLLRVHRGSNLVY